MPPPLLHTRSGNEIYEQPLTPTQNGFTTPVQTPQGSPSKKLLPPGAKDLPNVFDNVMKLAFPSPSRGHSKPSDAQGLSVANDNISRDPFADHTSPPTSLGSPAEKSNKENTPPGGFKLGQNVAVQQNQAAVSRQEQYQQTESRKIPSQTRGLSAEELQKVQNPKVKRLANVTQLCESRARTVPITRLTTPRLSRPLL